MEPVAAGHRTDIWSDSHPHYRLFSAGVQPANILVCKLDHVGDFSLAIEALCALRAGFSMSRIVLACAPWNVAIAQALGLFDEVVSVAFFPPRADTPVGAFDPATLLPLVERHFDLAIDLRIDPDTRVVLDHIDATLTAGYESDRCALPLSIALPLPATSADGDDLLQHQSLLMLRLAQNVLALLRPPHAMRDALRQRLVPVTPPPALADLPRPLVAVCTGSGRKAKDWPLSRFASIVEWLCEVVGASVVLLGSSEQLPDANFILRTCRTPNLRSLVNKTTLLEAIGVVGHAGLFVGNDTSLTHYAARLGVPTVALFSGIDPTAVWAPVGEHVTVLRAPVPCSPCHILRIEDCRNSHACMNNITVAAVKRVIRKAVLQGALAPCFSHEPAAPRAEPLTA
jgi:ADP-heptose:LPS heptosyltransferase